MLRNPSSLPVQFGLQLALVCSLVLALAAVTNAQRRDCPPVERCVRALKAGKPCPLLPVPRDSIPSPIPPIGYSLKMLRPGVFSYSDGAYRSLIVYRGENLALVDFPASQGSLTSTGFYLLLGAVRRVVRKPLKTIHMIYTHRHFDHIGFAGRVKRPLEREYPDAKLHVYGTEETHESLRRAKGNSVPLPDVIIPPEGLTVPVGKGLRVKLVALGGHTASDLGAFVPPTNGEPGVLHFVDIVTIGFVPFLDFGITEDFFGYVKAHETALKLDFRIFSSGHGEMGTRFDMVRNLRYTNFVLKSITEAASEVDPAEFAKIGELTSNPNAVEFANRHYSFAKALELQTNICVIKVIERWGCVVGAADLFAASHCKEAFFFNLVDRQDD